MYPPVAQLSVEWLRRRCPPQCFGIVAELPQADHAAIPAAVLIPIIARASGLTVLLTRRTAHLRDHAGQVSFPGGRCEPVDPSPLATALRECQEEVGIRPEQVEVLTILPEYLTSTGFRITPVVGLVTPPFDLHLDDFEVAEVLEPPLAFLLDTANYRRDFIEYRGVRREYWMVLWQGHLIWGATAGMLASLRDCLLGAS